MTRADRGRPWVLVSWGYDGLPNHLGDYRWRWQAELARTRPGWSVIPRAEFAVRWAFARLPPPHPGAVIR